MLLLPLEGSKFHVKCSLVLSFQGEGENEGKEEEEEENDEDFEDEEGDYSDDGDYNMVCWFTLYILSLSLSLHVNAILLL